MRASFTGLKLLSIINAFNVISNISCNPTSIEFAIEGEATPIHFQYLEFKNIRKASGITLTCPGTDQSTNNEGFQWKRYEEVAPCVDDWDKNRLCGRMYYFGGCQETAMEGADLESHQANYTKAVKHCHKTCGKCTQRKRRDLLDTLNSELHRSRSILVPSRKLIHSSTPEQTTKNASSSRRHGRSITDKDTDENGCLVFGFEDSDRFISTWKLSGDAFISQPTRVNSPVEKGVVSDSIGAKGMFYIDTNLPNGNRATGRAESPPFKLTGSFLSYLIGGGGVCKGGVYVEFIDVTKNESIARNRGRCEWKLERRWTYVGQRLGHWIKVIIVDESQEEWGSIAFDDLRIWKGCNTESKTIFSDGEYSTNKWTEFGTAFSGQPNINYEKEKRSFISSLGAENDDSRIDQASRAFYGTLLSPEFLLGGYEITFMMKGNGRISLKLDGISRYTIEPERELTEMTLQTIIITKHHYGRKAQIFIEDLGDEYIVIDKFQMNIQTEKNCEPIGIQSNMLSAVRFSATDYNSNTTVPSNARLNSDMAWCPMRANSVYSSLQIDLVRVHSVCGLLVKGRKDGVNSPHYIRIQYSIEEPISGYTTYGQGGSSEIHINSYMDDVSTVKLNGYIKARYLIIRAGGKDDSMYCLRIEVLVMEIIEPKKLLELPPSCFPVAVGIEEGLLDQSQFYSDFSLNSDTAAKYARLNFNDGNHRGWAPKKSGEIRPLEIDLKYETPVCGFATQGMVEAHSNECMYTTDLIVSYGLKPLAYKNVGWPNGWIRVFHANFDCHNIVYHSLGMVIQARYLYFSMFLTKRVDPALRLEVYRCHSPMKPVESPRQWKSIPLNSKSNRLKLDNLPMAEPSTYHIQCQKCLDSNCITTTDNKGLVLIGEENEIPQILFLSKKGEMERNRKQFFYEVGPRETLHLVALATNLKDSGYLVWLKNNRTVEGEGFQCKRKQSLIHCWKKAEGVDSGTYTALLSFDFTLHDKIDVQVMFKGSPKIKALTQKTTVACQHSTKTLSIEANGDPVPDENTITWYHSGIAIRQENNKYHITRNGRQLSILDYSIEDEGEYVVKVETVAGMASEKFSIEAVIIPPTMTPKSPMVVSTQENSEVRFSVNVIQANDVHWEYDGKHLQSSHKYGISAGELVIREITPKDGGIYTSVADGLKCQMRLGFRLYVKYPSTIHPFPLNLHTHVGSDFTVSIPYEKGYPSPLIRWTKSNETGVMERISTSANNELKTNGNQLIISNTKEKHHGTYTMTILNGFYETSASFTLNVHGNPYVVPFKNLYTVQKDKMANVSVHYGGKPLPQIFWYNGLEEVGMEGKKFLVGDSTASMTIYHANANDSVEYRVVAESDKGQSVALITLEVINVAEADSSQIQSIASLSVAIVISIILVAFIIINSFLMHRDKKTSLEDSDIELAKPESNGSDCSDESSENTQVSMGGESDFDCTDDQFSNGESFTFRKTSSCMSPFASEEESLATIRATREETEKTLVAVNVVSEDEEGSYSEDNENTTEEEEEMENQTQGESSASDDNNTEDEQEIQSQSEQCSEDSSQSTESALEESTEDEQSDTTE